MGGEAKLSQLVFYVIALVAIGGALLSPLDDLASYLLIAHMVQHELLIMVAPPFILLANPVPVLLWSLGRNPRLQAGPSSGPSLADTPCPRSLRLDARWLGASMSSTCGPGIIRLFMMRLCVCHGSMISSMFFSFSLR